ncbi:26S proteasome non-ATPase regulatory subunit 4, partial [Tanacetum coccineum]
MDSKTTTTMANDDQEKEEVTLIVVDNSWFMWSAASLGAYYNQLEAIELYCHAKLETCIKVLNSFSCIMYGGDLDLCRGVSMSLSIINQHTFKHKRLLFFVGGPSKIPPYSAKASGYTAKQMGVAVDVVNFFLLENYNYCKTSLDKFVAAANNNGNSHIKHIPPASSYTEIRDALS